MYNNIVAWVIRMFIEQETEQLSVISSLPEECKFSKQFFFLKMKIFIFS